MSDYIRQNEYDTYFARTFRPGSIDRKLRRDTATEAYEQSMADFSAFDFTNPYANLTNRFENLTVDTQAADFQQANLRQNLADVLNMQSSRGAGTSAANAQALLRQANESTRQASLDIGRQERQNQMTSLNQATQIDRMLAQGENLVQQREFDRLGTLLGMNQAELAGAYADINAVRQANIGLVGDLLGAGGEVGSSAILAKAMSAAAASDERLKENILQIAVSDSGIPVYKYNYIGGSKTYQGVMAQDLIGTANEGAVVTMDNGYYAVLYDKIDVDFKLMQNV